MMILSKKVFFLPVIVLMLSGCFGSSTKPALLICEELDDNEEWVEPAVLAQQKYGTPISLSLVLLELPLSDLDKKHVRPRSADWDEYRIRSERWDASPQVPADAVDFIGWFTQQSVKRNNIAWQDAGEHYLALRLGHGGYHRFEADKYPELAQQTKGVELRAQRWSNELQACKGQWQGESWFNKLKLW